MDSADIWRLALFIAPLVALYIALLIWSTHKDQWKR